MKKSIFFILVIIILLPLIASAAWDPNNYREVTGLPTGSVYNIIGAIMYWILAILGFIAIIGFVISGIQYLTSAGNQSMVDSAKKSFTYSLIGLIVALSGYVIVKFIDSALNANPDGCADIFCIILSWF